MAETTTAPKGVSMGWLIAIIIIAVALVSGIVYWLTSRQKSRVPFPDWQQTKPDDPSIAPDYAERAIGQSCTTASGYAGTYVGSGVGYVCQSIKQGNPCLLSGVNAGAGIAGVFHRKPDGNYVCVRVGGQCTTSAGARGSFSRSGVCVMHPLIYNVRYVGNNPRFVLDQR